MTVFVDDDIKKILDEQSALIKEIHKNVTALHRAMVLGRVWSIFSIIAFVILPLALAYYYVYPAFQGYLNSFKEVTSGQMSPSQFMGNIPPLFQGLMKLQGIDLSAVQNQVRSHAPASSKMHQ